METGGSPKAETRYDPRHAWRVEAGLGFEKKTVKWNR
jgi:hypothetical protein